MRNRFTLLIVSLIMFILLADLSNNRPATVWAAATATAEANQMARTVHFTTQDGATLQGTLYGNGTTVVIFSAMGAQKQDTWTATAQAVAQQGYLTFTYNFRYWITETQIEDRFRNLATEDLLGAVNFVRQQGAQHVVLVGASLGGMATAKAAALVKPDAIVIMSAPMSANGLEMQVMSDELQAISAPKLFIGSQDDTTVAHAELRRMFDAAPQPKEIHVYPGTAHGTDMFSTEYGSSLTQLLITFIEDSAPASPATIATATSPAPLG